MQQYTFILALRIWHPSVNPDIITSTLGFAPSRFWQVGESRSTPKGTPLEGTRQESYWHAEPLGQGWRDSAESEAEVAIFQLIGHLSLHAEFLLNLVSTGARALIQVSSHGPGNYAIVLSPDLLMQCSRLGLSFAHDVYATEQA